MRELRCDCCNERMESVFASQQNPLKGGGWIDVVVGPTEGSMPELCWPCILMILSNDKHPMRDLLEKKP